MSDSALADLKRLLERLHGDLPFQECLAENPTKAALDLGLTTDIQQYRRAWDSSCSDPEHPAFAALREDFRAKLAYRDRVRQEGCPSHPRLRAWRQRQLSRCSLQLGSALADAIVHPPWSVELTRGCSVGCWFCGLSAVGLTAVYPYNDENQKIWARLLDLMAHWLGPAARWGFCYWATDPLDNPDYEKFCVDFSDRLGMFPQTTTAQAWRHPERVKQLLRLSEERGCLVNRFSVLTLGLLGKIHQAFTPEEMLKVECVLQNREAPSPKAQAGHARAPKKNGSAKAAQVTDEPTTIACVTGFVLNMVTQSVELVTPCPADDRWPNGYYVLQSARFENLEHLEELIQDWVSRLPLAVGDLPRLRLARGLSIHPEAGGLLIQGHGNALRLTCPQLHQQGLISLLAEGRHKAEEIAFFLQFQYATPENVSQECLRLLFERGCLDEEPD